MFKHSIFIALRNFKRYRGSFLINVFGLATGLACTLFILLWIQDELKYNRFHKNGDRIYQVINHFDIGDRIITLFSSPLLLAEALREEYPEVEDALTINADFCTPVGRITHDGKSFQTSGLLASPNFFDFFTFKLVAGDEKTVLDSKEKMVISEDLAIRIFGSTNAAIGKFLHWNYKWDDGIEDFDVFVSGVFEKVPEHSTIQFDVVANDALLIEADETAGNWSGHYSYLYLMLNENVDPRLFEEKIEGTLNGRIEGRNNFHSEIQKFQDRYLYEPYEDGVQAGGKYIYLRLFSYVAVFILLLACINFMNLSTAFAFRKSKEIGIKKTIGAGRKSLIIQYLIESLFLVIISLSIGLLIIYFLLPEFNQLTGKNIQMVFSIKNIFLLLTLGLITGLVAGSYPAFYLSKVQPGSLLKKTGKRNYSEKWIRSSLVVFQFTISTLFILGFITITNQLDFMINKNLGYNKNNVIHFEMGSSIKSPEVFVQELRSGTGVKNVGIMNGTIVDGSDFNGGFSWNGDPSNKEVVFQSPRVGTDLIEALGIKVLKGSSFIDGDPNIFSKIIINESAARLMELEDPVGAIIEQGENKYTISGVVNDFQYGSMHEKIKPLIFRYRNHGKHVFLSFNEGSEQDVIKNVEKKYSEFNPGTPFEFSYLNQDYQELYKPEEVISKLSRYFGILAIIISCMGLLGLVAFTIEERGKEFSIRKILGSHSTEITKILGLQFLKMIILALLIALPIGYFLSEKWLNNFGQSIELRWYHLLIAGSVTLLVTIFTISFQSFRAAFDSPLKYLRNE